MAQAPIINLNVEQGTDYIADFLLKDSAGDAIDLVAASAVARMKVKDGYSLGSRTFLNLSSEDSDPYLVFHRGGVVGRVSIVLPDDATIGSTFLNNDETLELFYDLEVEAASIGGVKRVAKGEFNLYKELTDN